MICRYCGKKVLPVQPYCACGKEIPPMVEYSDIQDFNFTGIALEQYEQIALPKQEKTMGIAVSAVPVPEKATKKERKTADAEPVQVATVKQEPIQKETPVVEATPVPEHGAVPVETEAKQKPKKARKTTNVRSRVPMIACGILVVGCVALAICVSTLYKENKRLSSRVTWLNNRVSQLESEANEISETPANDPMTQEDYEAVIADLEQRNAELEAQLGDNQQQAATTDELEQRIAEPEAQLSVNGEPADPEIQAWSEEDLRSSADLTIELDESGENYCCMYQNNPLAAAAYWQYSYDGVTWNNVAAVTDPPVLPLADMLPDAEYRCVVVHDADSVYAVYLEQ